MTMQQPPDPGTTLDRIERFRPLYTGLVYDALDELGFPDQALATEIRPLRQDMVVAGPAFTIKGINDPTGDPDLRVRRIKLFKAMRYPCVDVRDCSLDFRVAHFGEMNAVLGRACGAVGTVIDGGVRDSRHLLEMDFPTFRRYHSPVEAVGRWSYYQWQVPISLRGALSAMVTVSPGDFIFGDIDGVLVIPQAIVDDVLRLAEETHKRECSAREEFSAPGADPEAVYAKYGKL